MSESLAWWQVGTLSARKASIYTAMVASALGFLGERHIAHRDLKEVVQP